MEKACVEPPRVVTVRIPEHAGQRSGHGGQHSADPPNRLSSARTRVRHAAGMVSAITPESCPSWAGVRTLEKKVAEQGILLTEAQIAALERKREEQQECGEIETAHPGYLGSQDTFYVGNMKGVGRIYQQTFVDTYAKAAFAKLYTSKTPITAADMLNDRVLPFYQEHQVPLLRILTDRGSEYCGRVEQHDFQLYMAVNDIDHTRTKAQSPQTNGICERFHKTILNEFYQVAFRKKIYGTMEELQADLDVWIYSYNHERTHQGKVCCGRTPMATFEDGKEICREKTIA